MTNHSGATGASGRPGRDTIGTIEDLHASATKLTGLDDFGPDDYRDALEVLLDSYETEAGLTPWGNKSVRASLRGALAARSLAEAAWTQYPEHAEVTIEQPVFVTGIPRTGTTALHRLLCADPSHQGLEVWLTEAPQPRPSAESLGDNSDYQALRARFERFNSTHPDFAGVHYVTADTVEECWRLLHQSMRSVSFESLAHIPSYSRWLAGQDWTDTYRRYKRNLQLIGLNDQDRRWVLKNPCHLVALDAIMAVFPDALIVVTHRDPRIAVASACSLSAQARDGESTVYRGAVIGRDQLDLLSREAQIFAAARAKYDPAQFIDVQYQDFASDPLGTVEGVYRHFGLPLLAEAREAIASAHTDSLHGERRPSHHYTLEEFGLTAEEVTERFAGYAAG